MSPFYGFLHKDYADNPALASDLMEEWRSVVVDSVVLSLVQGNEIRREHFARNIETDAVLLTKEGMSIFISKFERKMNSEIKYLKYDNKAVPIRIALNEQCKRLRESLITKEVEAYQAIVIR